MSQAVFADIASSATVVIKRPTEVVWPYLFEQAAWMTEFKLEKSGEVKIFTFAREHEQLKNKSEAMSYIYRLDGDTLYEVPALLLNRNSWTDKPMIVVWHRVIKPAN